MEVVARALRIITGAAKGYGNDKGSPLRSGVKEYMNRGAKGTELGKKFPGLRVNPPFFQGAGDFFPPPFFKVPYGKVFPGRKLPGETKQNKKERQR
jgi:hypothetical protein